MVMVMAVMVMAVETKKQGGCDIGHKSYGLHGLRPQITHPCSGWQRHISSVGGHMMLLRERSEWKGTIAVQRGTRYARRW
jgi:hypothetical protein